MTPISICLFSYLMLEHLLERHAKDISDAKRDLQRRRILAEFDGVDGLARDGDPLGELLLRHLVMIETKSTDIICDRST